MAVRYSTINIQDSERNKCLIVLGEYRKDSLRSFYFFPSLKGKETSQISAGRKVDFQAKGTVYKKCISRLKIINGFREAGALEYMGNFQ